ncbi:MAG: hypothetical protein WC004_04735 [Candidatus Absconditabacterales bacterium]
MEASLKLGLVEQYVEHQDIMHILPQAWLPYLELTLKYSAVVLILAVAYTFLDTVGPIVQGIMAIAGLLVFAKYIYDFLNAYMDTVVLTDRGVTIVTIEGWFTYKVDFFEWKNISSLRFTQSGLIQKIFNEGAVTISLDHDSDYVIQGVSHPQRQCSIINKLKFDMLTRVQQEEQSQQALAFNEPDKFEVLVDTLGEVINSYMRGQR